jgi:hypothetical protein
MPATASVSGRLSGYLTVDTLSHRTFKVVGQNIGAKLNVNGRIIIDAFFPQSELASTVSIVLQPGRIHFFILDFFSSSSSTPRNIELLSAETGSSTFHHLHGAFYNVKGKNNYYIGY